MVNANHPLGTDKICLECNREFTGIISNCPHDNAVLFNRTQDPFVGTTLAGNYEIRAVIGHGGMGVVYKARHILMDRTVAIKMLHPQLVSDSMSVKRFQQEGQAATRIKHEHVITVYDFSISPTGQPYIVMDFLEGEALSDVIKRDGNVAVERAIKIMIQSCDAFEHAHRQGVVHRDIKPTNIVLTKFNEQTDFVKVVDFGVAKLMNSGTDGQRLTQAGEVCGSPVYMSPEQCMGMDLDPRSDIYSMGIVIYETLTGRLPIIGKTMVDTMSKHISEMPTRFSESRPDLYIPERLEAVIFKALAKHPDDRHQTMHQLMHDLELAIPRPGRSEVLRSVPSPDAYQVPKGEEKAPKKPIVPIAIGAVAVLSALIGGIIFMTSRKPAPTPAVVPTPVVAPAATTTAPAVTKETPATTTPTATVAPAVVPKAVAPKAIELKPVAAVVHPVHKKPPVARHIETAHAAAPAVKKANPFDDLRNDRSSAR